MPIDGFFFTCAAAELSRALVNARVQGVRQPTGSEILLVLRKPGETLQLLISTRPDSARIHLTERSYENPISPPPFCLLLRKHLIPGRIVDVRQPPFERVLHIAVEGYGERGGRTERVLVAEVMGRHSNLVLVDAGTGLVVDAQKRIHGEENAYREVLPGRPYVPPPPQQKLDPRTAAFEEFERAIRHMGADTTVDRALQRAVAGVSPFGAREIAWRAGVDPAAPKGDLGPDGAASLWTALREIVQAIDEGRCRPASFTALGKSEFWCFPSERSEGEPVIYGSAQELLDRYFERVDEEEAVRSLARKIEAALRQNRARLEKKIGLQKEAIREAKEADELRKAGDLLTANLHRLRELPPGQTSVTLDDFEDGSPVTVALDPKLSASENAQSYYRRYQRAKKTLEKASEQLRASELELAYLESVEAALMLAGTAAELEEIYDELAKGGYFGEGAPGGEQGAAGTGKGGPGGGPKAGAKKREPKALEPLRFRSSDGFDIAVGRNNRQNDQLSLRIARPDDLWLHTKEIPGAHVVVFARGVQVPERTVAEAAALAALHSKARRSSNVPVDYTLCRHVRKPRGAKPGMVIYDHHKTVFVTPDEDLAERLAVKERPGRP